MKRPPLHQVPLREALQPGAVITMSPKQWDGLLEACYNDGWTLLEVDRRERPVRAFRLPSA